MLARLIGEHIAFETRLDPSPGAVRVDRGHLQQVLTNLVVNARDAMPGGGELRLEVSSVELDRRQAAQRGVPAGPYVVLTVIDSGHGMSAEVLAHIFEPFFTTKGRDGGTGLGLATAYAIRQSGGHIEAESAPESGTTFRIYLPRAPNSAIASAPESSTGVVLTGRVAHPSYLALVVKLTARVGATSGGTDSR